MSPKVLRAILEKTASSHGYENFSACIRRDENDVDGVFRYISTAVQEEEIDLAATHRELVETENAIQKARGQT